MKPIRVLIVDDSAVMRRMVRQVLSSDPEIEIVGAATNGRIALEMIEELAPDAITLDIEMPEMSGLEMLRKLRLTSKSIRVVMFSTLSERGARATLDALAAGADDYVTKPSNTTSIEEGMSRIRLQLIPKLKALCWMSMTRSQPSPSTQARSKEEAGLTPAQRVGATANPPANVPVPQPWLARAESRSSAINAHAVEVLIIGTSTGGPNALGEVIPCLPADLPVPVLIVQHMPPMFTRFLAERLSSVSKIPVVEATAGDVLQPGKAWIAPGDYHMTLRPDRSRMIIETDQREKENSCRPSVDVLFRSVAQIFGARTLAVIMTGMGQDGLKGCERVSQMKGQIFAQDEPSSVVWGMPGFVVKAGLADKVLPLQQLGPEIVRRVAAHRHTPSFSR